MANLLPPVIATLIADTKEYMAKMSEAQTKMTEFGTTTELTSAKLTKFAGKAATAITGLGVAMIGYGVDSALKFQESLRQIENQSNLTGSQVQALGRTIMDLSNQTAISTSDLSGAALIIAQAGVKGAQATNLLTDASKAAVITNASVIDTTKALISAQTLQIAKGMDLNTLTGVLVAGSKTYVGGLQAEEAMLSGRVGVALSNYGLKLKDIISIGSTFAGVSLPTRSIVSFTAGLNNLLKPTTDAKGKLTTYDKSLQRLGLSQTKLAADFRNGNLIGMFQQINDAAKKGGGPLSNYVNTVFGTSGGGAASVIIKNLQKYIDTQKNLTGKGAGSLAESFGLATNELPFKLKQLKTEAKNALTGIGLFFLPTITDLAHWAENAIKFFQKHPLIKTIADDAAISVFVGAILFKLGQGLGSIVKSIRGAYQSITGTTSAAIAETQGATQITLLTEIAANTAIMAGTGATGAAAGAAKLILPTAAEAGTVGAGIAAGMEGAVLGSAGVGAVIGEAIAGGFLIAIAAGGAVYISQLLNKVPGALAKLNDMLKGLNPLGQSPEPTPPTPTKPSKPKPKRSMVNVDTSESIPGAPGQASGLMNLTYSITKNQKAALDAYFKSHHLAETQNGVGTTAYNNALTHFVQQDFKGNYSVTVNIKG
jgi:TP901 family phage tail tape measure protein